MKRMMALAMACVMAVLLFGCGQKAEPIDMAQPEETEITTNGESEDKLTEGYTEEEQEDFLDEVDEKTEEETLYFYGSSTGKTKWTCTIEDETIVAVEMSEQIYVDEADEDGFVDENVENAEEGTVLDESDSGEEDEFAGENEADGSDTDDTADEEMTEETAEETDDSDWSAQIEEQDIEYTCVFKGLKEGKTDVTFRYVQESDPSVLLEMAVYEVEVDADKMISVSEKDLPYDTIEITERDKNSRWRLASAGDNAVITGGEYYEDEEGFWAFDVLGMSAGQCEAVFECVGKDDESSVLETKKFTIVVSEEMEMSITEE